MELRVSKLSFSYGAREVLRDVGFSLCAGEILAVLGPNGAGKSTLFSCILGLLRPKSGCAELDGRDVMQYSPARLAEKLAFVPQSHTPTFNYSVFDMVLMGTTARVGGFSSPKESETASAQAALERAGISELRSRGYFNISGGEKQLALIARALAQNAKTLIMDEPTANLDYGNQLRVLMQLRSLSHEGYAVVFSTHNPEHTFRFADRVLALCGGGVAACGAPGEAVTAELISRLYGVSGEIRTDSGGHTYLAPNI
ncbi:MAG: ABC transporter ATP-binding protein [Oscillospiraceae bacterium]|jgi:iron complex transport system ATP-binding protein|nr:ABC transporter ATP-binding protein [Oscillospiraceae bacterium]